MQATLQRIRDIAEEVAGKTGEFDVAGVIPTAGDTYVEILLTQRGCRVEPCRVELGVVRNMPPEQLRQAIADQLQRHVAEHPR